MRSALGGLLVFILLLSLVSAAPTPGDDAFEHSKEVVTRLLCILYLLSPGVVFTMIVVSVFFLLLHAEHPEKRAAAKTLLVNAVLGGVMVVALVQVATLVGIVIDLDSCLGSGGVGPEPPGPVTFNEFLVWPPNGETVYTHFQYASLFMIPLGGVGKWKRG
ncbi:MAG: hypothetical protein ABH851_06970 [Methanobacteriota archaeon]